MLKLNFKYLLYSYLNLESTKTSPKRLLSFLMLYSYLNLESTKTFFIFKALY